MGQLVLRLILPVIVCPGFAIDLLGVFLIPPILPVIVCPALALTTRGNLCVLGAFNMFPETFFLFEATLTLIFFVIFFIRSP
ncbi:possible transmembrane protein [Candidatus Pelagibacter ubique HTCC1062]|uniref:Possible transmembrane protein n=1 Tax=Pelagibacter ubique (strain HTCC1062) TaxID=335992 RepID=Q4FM46_PELUB|nr:possible transmembrane protein [Candidatus Pelagibacter ubique HTCC1062]